MMNVWELAQYYRTGGRAGVVLGTMFAFGIALFLILTLFKRGQNGKRPGICSSCGSGYPPQARFCPKCGKAIS